MMTTLTVDGMQVLHGAVRQNTSRRRGAFCGLLAGAVFGFALTGNFVAAAAVYTFTPVTCLFDYAL
jgi:hypothetical protein